MLFDRFKLHSSSSSRIRSGRQVNALFRSCTQSQSKSSWNTQTVGTFLHQSLTGG
jgi:hypothetical protein